MIEPMHTERLMLRWFEADDREAVQAILSNPAVTATLLDIPEPFTLDDAERWIDAGHTGMEGGLIYPFAMIRREDRALIGCIDIEVMPPHRRGDLAYWLDPCYWGQGYTSEAARRMVRFGFETLGLYRVYAQCLSYNVASARVMEKAGLKYEATLRGAAWKAGRFVDMLVYGLTQPDFQTES